MNSVDIFSVAKDLVVALAAALTALAAIFGLRSWSVELKGKSDFETARSLMRATYKVREELVGSRSPLIVNSEFPEGYGGLGDHTAEEEANAYNHVFRNRWEPVSESLIELDSQALEAEALWGAPIKERVDTLKQCAREIVIAMEAIVDDKIARGENFRADSDFGVSMRSKAFASRSSEDNQMNIRIRDATAEIENIVRPHLQRN